MDHTNLQSEEVQLELTGVEIQFTQWFVKFD